MDLGVIQEQWLKNLEEHPERQTGGRLGRKNEDGGYSACCLGEYLITYRKQQGLSDDEIWTGEQLLDGDSYSDVSLEESWEDMGLYNTEGNFKDNTLITASNGNAYDSLAEMNDSGITWPEIARHIRENIDLVFQHSM